MAAFLLWEKKRHVKVQTFACVLAAQLIQTADKKGSGQVSLMGNLGPFLYGQKMARGPEAPSPRANRGGPSFPTIANK